MVQIIRTVFMLLFLYLMLPDLVCAQSVDDLLESDSGDAELFDDGSQSSTEAAKSKRPRRMDTVLLDIQPVNSSEAEAQLVYDAVLETIKLAEDLGEINGRLELGSSIPEMHPMEKCRSIDNKRCIRQTGIDINARYLIYGSLRDMDDVYLIELELMDVKGGEVLQDVRTQIVKPSTKLPERAAEAACRLTRMYGCRQDEMMAAGSVAVAPVPVGGNKRNSGRRSAADDESYFEEDSKPTEQQSKSKPSDDENDFAGEEKAPEKPLTVAERKPPREAEQEQLVARESYGRGSDTKKILGYTFAGIGAAALVGCAATTALMYVKYDEYKAVKETDSNASSKAVSKKKDVKNYYWASIGLGAGAAVSGGLSLMFFMLDRGGSGDLDSAQSDWSAVPMLTSESSGIIINGKF